MNRLLTMPLLMALAILPGASIQAADAKPLTHNPFSRPPSEVTVDARPVVLADGSVQSIELRATMVASNNGLANVGGRILRPGDDIQGYTLLRVFEDRAVFSREGKSITVYVKPGLEEDDE